MITLDTDAPLGKGGEAQVYGIVGEPDLAAKVYEADKDLSERITKLTVMRALPPDLPTSKDGHVSIAWPLDLLCDVNDATRVRGFLMARVHNAAQIIDVYHPQTRLRESPLFDYRYLLRAARNLAAAVRACHARGYVIGDLKHSNVLVTQTALVTLVDTDSFQVRDPETQQLFACPVRTPDFTPPELQEGEKRRGGEEETEEYNAERGVLNGELNFCSSLIVHHSSLSLSPSHDLFALGVLIFHLLMEGTHPFAGVYLEDGDPPPFEERIARGHFPYGAQTVPYRPNTRYAPPFDMLPPTLRELFAHCFEDGYVNPDLRPDARTWQRALDEAGRQLARCDANPQHFYSNHLDACPWCVRKTTQLRGLDPFPSEQTVLERTKVPATKGKTTTAWADGWQQSPSAANSVPSAANPPPSNSEIMGVVTFVGALAFFFLFIVIALNSDKHTTNAVSMSQYSQDVSTTASASNFVPTPAPYASATPAPAPTAMPVVPDGTIAQVAYSPDGKTIVGIGKDILLWNAQSGKLKRKIPLDNPAFVDSHFGGAFAFAPDSKTLAINSGGKAVKLWDVAAGKCRLTIPAQGSSLLLAYSHDGKLLAVGNQKGKQDPNCQVIKIIAARTGKTLHELKSYVANMTALHFAPQENTLVSGGMDSNIASTVIRARENNCIEAWDAQTGTRQWMREGLVPIEALVFAENGKKILAAGTPFRSWDAQTGEPTPTPSTYLLSQEGFAFSTRQDRILIILPTHDAEMLNAETGAEKFFLHARSASEDTNAPVGYTSAAFSPDGKYIVTGSYTKGAQIWDARSGRLLRALESAAGRERVTASGLKYVDLVEGTGKKPHAGQQVTVHYVGTFTNGATFDSSRARELPFTFTIGREFVIKGWEEGIATMRVGGRRRLTIPPSLAYGSAGVSNTIPPDSTLIFDVELLQVKDLNSP